MLEKLKQYSESPKWPKYFAILLVIFTLLRVAYINNDAPQDLSLSAALYTDEGFKAYSARNLSLFGNWNWTPEDQYPGWHNTSPVPTAIYNVFFNIFGSSITTIRVISAVFAFFSMIILFFLVRRFYDNFTAFTALTIFGVDHFIMMSSRLGLFESYLTLYILIIIFCFSELYNRLFILKDETLLVRKTSFTETAAAMGLFLAGMIFIGISFLTKRNINVVILSVIPYFFLFRFYTHHKLNNFVRNLFYTTIALIMLTYILLAHTGVLENFFRSILSNEFISFSLTNLIPLHGVGNFDSLPVTLLKTLYLEFIFLHPMLFFTAAFFAMYTFYRLLYNSRMSVYDMFFATWFLFGMLFLGILKYHPSRYYMVLIVPFVILAARFFSTDRIIRFSNETHHIKKFAFKFATIGYVFYIVYYFSLSVFIHLVPFATRKEMMNFMYYRLPSPKYFKAVPLVMLLAVILIAFIVLFAMLMPRIKKMLKYERTYAVLFSVILIFHGYQYLKWINTSGSPSYKTSVQLGKMLPERSVITGGWSANLVLQNKLRAVVIQQDLDYNMPLIEKIMNNEEIITYRKTARGTITLPEKDIPLYLAVSKNGEFDKKIREYFKHYMTPANRLLFVEFGLYDISIYKIK